MRALLQNGNACMHLCSSYRCLFLICICIDLQKIKLFYLGPLLNTFFLYKMSLTHQHAHVADNERSKYVERHKPISPLYEFGGDNRHGMAFPGIGS